MSASAQFIGPTKRIEYLIERLARQALAEIAAEFDNARRDNHERFNSVARSNGQRFRYARQPRKAA